MYVHGLQEGGVETIKMVD